MGTIYPRSDHYPPNPEISKKISILQSCATQVGILQENFVAEESRHHFVH